jgi:hypothetical protein
MNKTSTIKNIRKLTDSQRLILLAHLVQKLENEPKPIAIIDIAVAVLTSLDNSTAEKVLL